ncbi:glycoside hydrolase [Mycena rebaudengoi]|nr:glycoside hydrolase [Mycena rebaudengoi]
MSSDSLTKYVFAHFMVGNTYPYTIEDWTEDIEAASANSIDGFVLNVGREGWQKDRVALCFEAAPRAVSPFYFFLSFDMSSVPSSSSGDVDLLRQYMLDFGHHPSMFRHKGKVVVSTFAGENSTFGQDTLDAAWAFVKDSIQDIIPIHFIPSFFIDPVRYRDISCMDGAFNWNGGWPIHLTPKHPRREIESPRLDSDNGYIDNLGGRTFMAAVSGGFFTHYGPESWNKNWIYRGDNWLLVRRWEQLIAMREHVDIVQVISWNDYGESHYICPKIKGAQPNSQAWVDGFPHAAWLYLNAYFARAFREGRYPPIEKDQIFLWGRPHPKAAEAAELVPRPRDWELTDDAFWVVVLCTAPARVSLYTSENDKKSFDVTAGVTKLSRAQKVGGGMRVKIKRRGAVVAECNADGFVFDEQPSVYNFNLFTAMS